MIFQSSLLRLRSSLVLLLAAACALAQNLVVDAPSCVANSISPIRSLGAGVDRIGVGLAGQMLVNPMLKGILASDWQPVTYRQNTELHAEAWHWNPQGTWSDPRAEATSLAQQLPPK
jgi:hypothetical protein